MSVFTTNYFFKVVSDILRTYDDLVNLKEHHVFVFISQGVVHGWRFSLWIDGPQYFMFFFFFFECGFVCSVVCILFMQRPEVFSEKLYQPDVIDWIQ